MQEDIEKQIEEEEKAYKKSLEREYKPKTLNFLNKMANTIYAAKRIIDIDVAFACSSMLLNSVLPYVRLKTSIGDLPLNEMNLIVGTSGTGKTLPFRIVNDILKNDLGVAFPGRFTVEGAEHWFSAKEEIIDNKGNIIGHGDYLNEPYCSIVTDEISQSFKESKKEYLAGSIELLSQFYDGELKGTALASHHRIPQSPIYVNLLGATVPEFIPSLPEFVFEQGLAGRIYWVYVEPQETLPTFSIREYKQHDKMMLGIKAYTSILKTLLDLNISKTHNPKREIIPLYMDSDVDELWNKYHMKKYNEWRRDRENKPNSYDWQYKRRLHELALKKAGTFAIGRGAVNICETKKFDVVTVNKSDMENAINWVKKSENYLKQILLIKKTGGVFSMNTRQAISNIYCPENLVVQLLHSKNGMLNTRQLWEASRIKNKTTFTKYLYKAYNKGLIKLVDKSSIISKEECERLDIEPNKPTKIWSVVTDLV